MPIPAAELEALRDALLRARAAGVRRVRYSDGREVEYGSDADMAKALADLDRRLAGRRPGAVAFSTSKGL